MQKVGSLKQNIWLASMRSTIGWLINRVYLSYTHLDLTSISLPTGVLGSGESIEVVVKLAKM